MKFCNVKTDMACMNASTSFWSWRSNQPYSYWRSSEMGVCNKDGLFVVRWGVYNKDFKVFRVLEGI